MSDVAIPNSKARQNSLSLKAINEQQDDGTGVMHQVAQHPIDPVYSTSIQGAHADKT